jgi:hypothetical protein
MMLIVRTCLPAIPSSHTAIQDFHKLSHFTALLFGISRRNRVLDAGIDVVLQDLTLHLFERGLNRRDLGEDVDTIALLADHARNASHLALDPGKPLQAVLLYVLLHGTLVPPEGMSINTGKHVHRTGCEPDFAALTDCGPTGFLHDWSKICISLHPPDWLSDCVAGS